MRNMVKPRSLTKWSVALAAVALVIPIVAQEGHPLKGSWIGVWENNSVHGDDVLVVMNWDGKAVTGVINPGTDDMKISNVTLTLPPALPLASKGGKGGIDIGDGKAADWKVHIEADAKDKAGKAMKYNIDGEIKDMEMYNRYIVGTWSSQAGKGKFEIRRQ